MIGFDVPQILTLTRTLIGGAAIGFEVPHANRRSFRAGGRPARGLVEPTQRAIRAGLINKLRPLYGTGLAAGAPPTCRAAATGVLGTFCHGPVSLSRILSRYNSKWVQIRVRMQPMSQLMLALCGAVASSRSESPLTVPPEAHLRCWLPWEENAVLSPQHAEHLG